MLYFIEQCLNGAQLGMLLFLLAAGLTLVFGIMDLVNLAHGSLYMLGAYFAATFAALTGSFVLALVLAVIASLSNLIGLAIGIWALVVLCQPTVRNAFEQERGRRPAPHRWWSGSSKAPPRGPGTDPCEKYPASAGRQYRSGSSS